MAHEKRGDVGGVAPEEELARTALDEEGGVPRRVAEGRERTDAGQHFRAGRKALHRSGKLAEHPPRRGKGALHRFGRGGHARVVHPPRPLGFGHVELGVGEDQGTGFVAQAVDVVAVEVREDDGVDRLRVDARRREVFKQLAGGGLAEFAVADVEQHALAADLDARDGVGNRQRVGRQAGLAQSRLHFGERCVAHEACVERPLAETVGEHGDAHRAQIDARHARRNTAGARRRRGTTGQPPHHPNGAERGTCGEKSSARQLHELTPSGERNVAILGPKHHACGTLSAARRESAWARLSFR